MTVKVTFQALSSETRVPIFLKTKQKFLVQYRTLAENADVTQPAVALVWFITLGSFCLHFSPFQIAKEGAGGPVQEKKIDCRFDSDVSYKSTHDKGTSPKGDGLINVKSCPDPVAPGEQTSGPCSLTRFFLIAFFILLIALAIGYKFGGKIPGLQGNHK